MSVGSYRIARGGGDPRHGAEFTSRDCWNRAFDNLVRADDSQENLNERRVCAAVGVAWARVARMMERAEAPTPESPAEKPEAPMSERLRLCAEFRRWAVFTGPGHLQSYHASKKEAERWAEWRDAIRPDLRPHHVGDLVADLLKTLEKP